MLLVVLAGAWLLLGWLSAFLGGWTRLASRYRWNQPFEGEIFPTRSAMLGMSRYENCLTMGANAKGLYLKVFTWMRINHPPLFIPWEDIQSKVEPSWLAPIVMLSFRPFPHVSMELPINTALELRRAALNPKAFAGITT